MHSPRVTPFQISVPDSAIAELHARVRHTRWAPAPSSVGWKYGMDPEYLRSLAEYWVSGFDWRVHETRLNRMAQFQTVVDGIPVHFVHERGRGPRPLPIILTHGWPGSFIEMERVIPLLTDPASNGGDASDAFDVIAPSVPGFGFSGSPDQQGMTPLRVAELWAELMTNVLGYDRYAAHGGDIGSSVTARLAYIDSQHVVGIHLTYVSGSALIRYLGPQSAPLTGAEREFEKAAAHWWEEEGAYAHLQRTKPQVVADALNDSPMGLAAWLVDKYRAWSDCGGDVERRYGKDDLLTIVMLYWITGTIGSSIRLYCDSRARPWRFGPTDRIHTPTGVALFPAGAPIPPREWAERIFNVQRWTEMPRGGHFAAHEEPELLAEEIRVFFRPCRQGVSR